MEYKLNDKILKKLKNAKKSKKLFLPNLGIDDSMLLEIYRYISHEKIDIFDLNLANNKIQKTYPVSDISSFKTALKTVNLNSNFISEKELEKLTTALPDCKIQSKKQKEVLFKNIKKSNSTDEVNIDVSEEIKETSSIDEVKIDIPEDKNFVYRADGTLDYSYKYDKNNVRTKCVYYQNDGETILSVLFYDNLGEKPDSEITYYENGKTEKSLKTFSADGTYKQYNYGEDGKMFEGVFLYSKDGVEVGQEYSLNKGEQAKLIREKKRREITASFQRKLEYLENMIKRKPVTNLTKKSKSISNSTDELKINVPEDNKPFYREDGTLDYKEIWEGHSLKSRINYYTDGEKKESVVMYSNERREKVESYYEDGALKSTEMFDLDGKRKVTTFEEDGKTPTREYIYNASQELISEGSFRENEDTSDYSFTGELFARLDTLRKMSIGSNPLKANLNLSGLDLKSSDLEHIVEGYINHYGFAITDLTLDHNDLSSLDSLKSLTDLKKLSLRNNQISDVTPLNNLTSLKSLNLAKNTPENLETLTDLNELETLNLENTSIQHVFFLENMKKLSNLNLSMNSLNSLTGIKELKQLKNLNLCDNNVSNIWPLSLLKNLEELRLDHNEITALNPLHNLKKLKLLHLENNKIKYISYLRGLSDLSNLHLKDNQIEDLLPLSKLQNLKHLGVSNNNIKDISVVPNLKDLLWLRASNNQITDVPDLTMLEHLDHIDLSRNRILSSKETIKDQLRSGAVINFNFKGQKKIRAFFSLLTSGSGKDKEAKSEKVEVLEAETNDEKVEETEVLKQPIILEVKATDEGFEKTTEEKQPEDLVEVKNEKFEEPVILEAETKDEKFEEPVALNLNLETEELNPTSKQKPKKDKSLNRTPVWVTTSLLIVFSALVLGVLDRAEVFDIAGPLDNFKTKVLNMKVFEDNSEDNTAVDDESFLTEEEINPDEIIFVNDSDTFVASEEIVSTDSVVVDNKVISKKPYVKKTIVKKSPVKKTTIKKTSIKLLTASELKKRNKEFEALSRKNRDSLLEIIESQNEIEW